MPAIDRDFVRIREGQVHLRRCLPREGAGAAPLVLLHSSPVASGSLVPLMRALAGGRLLVAPDTLGNGDSAPPDRGDPGLDYFADAALRLLDVLGLNRVDLYGVRTGALISAEVAIARPDRVRRLVLDEVSLPAEGEMERALETHSPEVEPDDMGRHLLWAWHVMRDHSLFHPWFARDRDHRLHLGLPPAGDLHESTLEVLKGLRTFHHSYRAAFRHPRRRRLPLIRVPTLVLEDPAHLASGAARDVAALVPGAALGRLPDGLEATAARAAVIEEFLSG